MNARELALKIISEINDKDAYANIALAKVLGKNELGELDRRFVTELVYGTIKTGETLDWIIGHYLTRPFSKVHHVIKNVLRLGAYQLFFLSKVPDSAACNETVNLAKKYGHPGTVKFVNAVMRSMARNPEKVSYPDPNVEPVKFLALKYCHPVWLVERWVKKLGFENCKQLLMINNETPPLCLRTNTIKIDRTSLLLRLSAEGIVCRPSEISPDGIVCDAVQSLTKLSSFKEGLFQIQDESSMLVGHVLDPKPGELIIDACAAPGGKSTHIAVLMQNKGQVLSFDYHPHKINLINENAEKLGISIIKAQAMDARNLCNLYYNQADRVLVDAPCSGLGVLRRRPDARWKKSAEQLNELPVLQKDILESAAGCVKPGGVLVYSTCTTEEEENQHIITEFLLAHREFILEQTGNYLPKQRTENLVQLWPHIDHVDGFFIARMKRMEAAEQ